MIAGVEGENGSCHDHAPFWGGLSSIS